MNQYEIIEQSFTIKERTENKNNVMNKIKQRIFV